VTYAYSVRKRRRGHHGQWFRSSGVGYATEVEAVHAAGAFAHSQCASGVRGTEIDVIARQGRKCIRTYRWPQGVVEMVDHETAR
jgi:hypothetical protein